jgi:phosphoribosyl 1,2-cyclic phosphodiesterase
LSRKEIFTRLLAIGEDPMLLDAVLVTHEHTDHVSGLAALGRGLECRVPVYMTKLTAPGIEWNGDRPPVIEFRVQSRLEMLKVGPYPWSVKQRVMSRVGHLSNPARATSFCAILDANVAHLVLGHLSEHNNHPEIVRISAEQALAERGARDRAGRSPDRSIPARFFLGF